MRTVRSATSCAHGERGPEQVRREHDRAVLVAVRRGGGRTAPGRARRRSSSASARRGRSAGRATIAALSAARSRAGVSTTAGNRRTVTAPSRRTPGRELVRPREVVARAGGEDVDVPAAAAEAVRDLAEHGLGAADDAGPVAGGHEREPTRSRHVSPHSGSGARAWSCTLVRDLRRTGAFRDVRPTVRSGRRRRHDRYDFGHERARASRPARAAARPHARAVSRCRDAVLQRGRDDQGHRRPRARLAAGARARHRRRRLRPTTRCQTVAGDRRPARARVRAADQPRARARRCGAASARCSRRTSSCRTPTSSTTPPSTRRARSRCSTATPTSCTARGSSAATPHRVLYYWHSVGNRFLTTTSNMFTNLNLTDMETCYKAFRLEVLRSVEIEEDRFGFEPEITAKIAAQGWRIYEVGISYNGRTYAEGKKIGWRDGCARRLQRAALLAACGRASASGIDRAPDRNLPPAQFEDADAELSTVLESLEGAERYADWILSLAEPHLGRRRARDRRRSRRDDPAPDRDPRGDRHRPLAPLRRRAPDASSPATPRHGRAGRRRLDRPQRAVRLRDPRQRARAHRGRRRRAARHRRAPAPRRSHRGLRARVRRAVQRASTGGSGTDAGTAARISPRWSIRPGWVSSRPTT